MAVEDSPAPAEARLSVPERLWQAFLGGAGYRRIGAQPQGAYAAFFLVAGITAAVTSVVMAWGVARGLTAISAAWHLLPDFSLSGGQWRITPPASLPLRVQADGASIVLVPTGHAHPSALGHAAVGMVLATREILLRTRETVRGNLVVPFSMLGKLPPTKANIGNLLSALSSEGLWLGAVVATGFTILGDLMRALIVTWIGLIAARFAGRNASWIQGWRVGLAAWTLPLLAELARLVIPLPVWSLWLVATVYAAIGCWALDRPA